MKGIEISYSKMTCQDKKHGSFYRETQSQKGDTENNPKSLVSILRMKTYSKKPSLICLNIVIDHEDGRNEQMC